jgi:hypothetical protein
MTTSKITEELLKKEHERVDRTMQNLEQLAKNDPLITQIGMIFTAAGFEQNLTHFGNTLTFNCFSAKNFKCAEHIIAAFGLLGVPAENWTTYANANSKYTSYKASVGDFEFIFNIFLGEDSKCKLIEESRETQEVVKYRMECDDE